MSTAIKISDILIEGRLREVDEDVAQGIASSMVDIGQHQPVLVRKTNAGKKPWTLVDGAHRIRARQILGFEDVIVEVKAFTKDQARLAEIDTNLIRHELTALDRAVFLAERKVIYERLYPHTKHGGDRKSGGAENQVGQSSDLKFTADVADRLGLSESYIEQSVLIANRLTPDMRKALQGKPEAKNQSMLLKLARLETDQRVMAINLFKEEVPLADAMVQACGGKPKARPFAEQKFEALVAAWKLAPIAARRRFTDLLGDEIKSVMEG